MNTRVFKLDPELPRAYLSSEIFLLILESNKQLVVKTIILILKILNSIDHAKGLCE